MNDSNSMELATEQAEDACTLRRSRHKKVLDTYIKFIYDKAGGAIPFSHEDLRQGSREKMRCYSRYAIWHILVKEVRVPNITMLGELFNRHHSSVLSGLTAHNDMMWQKHSEYTYFYQKLWGILKNDILDVPSVLESDVVHLCDIMSNNNTRHPLVMRGFDSSEEADAYVSDNSMSYRNLIYAGCSGPFQSINVDGLVAFDQKNYLAEAIRIGRNQKDTPIKHYKNYENNRFCLECPKSSFESAIRAIGNPSHVVIFTKESFR
jgi:hypothetical protein